MGGASGSYDVLVIGAGWAGLSVSYMLKQAGLHHVVYERRRICETWRRQRWASFRMNTPNVMTVLPGDRYGGDEPEGYMTGDEFVRMVELYALKNALPVQEHVEVFRVSPANDRFEVRSSAGTAMARNIVVASGNLNIPRRPAMAGRLPARIRQIDGSDYRDPASLPPGAILVVGCGNSGGQIAEDLALAGRRVFLSTGRNGRVPRRYRGRDIFIWLTETGRMARPRTTASGRGLIGATHTISLQSLSAQGVTLVGRLASVSEGGRPIFEDTLAESVSAGDEMSAMLRREIDDYIASAGIDAPPAVPDPAETVAPRFPEPAILELDLEAAGISSIVWCTGFRGNFGWLQVPGAIDEHGEPVHDRCASVTGVYFAGLDSSSSLRAGTVLVAADEAERIAGRIVAARGT